MTHSICLILLWFGEFPNYFPLFLHSCGKNRNIDFLLVSDNDLPNELPENFTYKKTQFIEIKHRLQSFFSFPIRLDSPYKLTDYKPAFGEVFQEELKNYEFWGWIDCDLILGDTSRYLTDNVLENYDKIYTHGHFSLFRNTKGINSIYRHGNIKQVFSSNYAFHYDEWGGISTLFKENGISQYDSYDMADIDATKFRFAHASSFGCFPQIFEYNNGRLICWFEDKQKLLNAERLYIHLQKRKMEYNPVNKDHYLILPNVFIQYIDDIESLTNQQKEQRLYPYWYFVRIKQIKENIKNGAIRRRVEKIFSKGEL